MNTDRSTRAVVAAVLYGLLASTGVLAAAAEKPAKPAFLVRDRSLELPTPYVAPPGNPLEHHAAGFAQIMCSAVFITGLDAGFAAENVGYFTAPYAVRAKLGKPVIDRNSKTVSVAVPDGITRVAKYLGDQGCVTFESGQIAPKYAPHAVPRRLPDPATQAWPDGDALPVDAAAASATRVGLDDAKVTRAVDAAFATPDGLTAAFIVTWHGQIIAEGYRSE